MAFFHHTPWQIDPATLPLESATTWDESHYWRSRSLTMEVQSPPPEVLEVLRLSMATIPVEQRGDLLRSKTSADTDERLIDVFVGVVTDVISPVAAHERIRSLKIQAEIEKEQLFEE